MRANAALQGYALCTFVLCTTLLWQQFPPCVDYPQHLGMALQLRELLLGGGDGRLVLWTYNGLFELVTGVMALVLPIDLSGRMVLASGLALTSLAVWRLVRFRGRPSVHAFAWLPLAYSFPFSWGLINFTLSAALATLALICWFERRPAWLFIALSLLTGLAHVTGALVLVAGVLVGAVLRTRDIASVLQLSPVLAWLGVAHVAAEPAPHLPWASQTFYPRWFERLQWADALLGSWQGPADELFAAAVGIIVVLGLRAAVVRCWRGNSRLPVREPLFWLTLLAAAGYAVGPLAVFGCWFFYQRAGYFVTLWMPAMLPRAPQGRWNVGQTAALVALGAAATANFLIHNRLGTQAADARAILEAIPSGAKVAAVLDLVPNQGGNETLRADSGSDALVWAHFPAYAISYRGAEIPWMFAREHGHFPVRLPVREGLPPVDYGWSRAFHPLADYAREFNHVLVLSGRRESTHNPKANVFGEAAENAVELAHQGRFWLFRFTPGPP